MSPSPSSPLAQMIHGSSGVYWGGIRSTNENTIYHLTRDEDARLAKTPPSSPRSNPHRDWLPPGLGPYSFCGALKEIQWNGWIWDDGFKHEFKWDGCEEAVVGRVVEDADTTTDAASKAARSTSIGNASTTIDRMNTTAVPAGFGLICVIDAGSTSRQARKTNDDDLQIC
ncbi:hypothetical protein M422DRAFT_256291 [Sphaerobolus stellatus SS14]|uniref:Unplaced genomic scaffold SPHSTscaffold_66, whole genome shotgun sequence n=1 Tax=Sphaerobolus stellatus (strain SS14) TaxID=990650 RepID=A0A0C9VRA2_SPHS4|nr:hypothetical protein M422DRAFT_256291 [Sphaerobolus stellatus SS14]